MDKSRLLFRRSRCFCRLAALAFCGWMALLPSVAWADADPPGRVGRLATLQGAVSTYEHGRSEWVPAARNRPLTAGDRVSTGADARAELRVGSTVLRLAGGSELEVLRLDDQRLHFQLHAGSLALRVRSREVAGEIEIVTAEARLRPQRSGHFRIDRHDDDTLAGSWRGELRVDGDERVEGFTVDAGRRVELWREGDGRALRHAWTSTPDDAFADWVARNDRDDERSAAARVVSPEMTGAEDLDHYGRWEQHPEHGSVWLPAAVAPGWAPYRYGRWAWVPPWGWTWVDDAPWGFAPFHYGRWLYWGGRWGWAPGVRVLRPVYAPALVAWVGGPGYSVSIGGSPFPYVGWVPLAPREVYVPVYVVTPIYLNRVNPLPYPYPGQPGRPRPPVQVPTGPVMYGNQGVPGAVTMVPRDVLVQRQPVAPAAVGSQHGIVRDVSQKPWVPGAAVLPAPPPHAPGTNPAPVTMPAPVARPVPPPPVQGPAPQRPVAQPPVPQPPAGRAPERPPAAAHELRPTQPPAGNGRSLERAPQPSSEPRGGARERGNLN